MRAVVELGTTVFVMPGFFVKNKLFFGAVYGKTFFLSTASDIKILQSIYFACKVGIISSCRIYFLANAHQQPFADVHLLRIVYFSLVYSRLIYRILNWTAAKWSSSADLIKLNIELLVLYLKLIVESIFHLEIYFIQHGYYRSRIFTITN